VLVKNPTNGNRVMCGYHGRCFDLDGSFRSMPETKGMENFPSPADNLAKAPFAQWSNFLFASINPAFDFSAIISDIQNRIGWMPLHNFWFEPVRSQDYLVKANWALYVDNYLEGFHIPFIHKDLASTLDYGNYSSEIYEYANLQLGIGKSGDVLFDLPPTSLDYGKNVAAYYYWLFPNMMLNFYPWGLSMNIVKPIAPELSKVSYRAYIWDETKLNMGAGGAIDKVEREDQNIVEAVQRGVKSRLYKQGRFSPKMEKGVHHFHTLLSRFMND
jgi:choline monooxygenase